MPRNFPWNAKKGGSSTTVIHSKGEAKTTKSSLKRSVSDLQESDDAGSEVGPVSSPAPELAEDCMVEGMDADDKFRMVEDEFLSIAKKFTVHLHTAEYKRKAKIAKSRNSDLISTIARPVIGPMPDQTRRKLEAKSRAKAQNDAIQNIVKEEAGDTDTADEDLPYIGTFLQGLMESPRKPTNSKLGSAKILSRAAAGLKSTRLGMNTGLDSYSPASKDKGEHWGAESTPSEDEDDLDAPILAPQFKPLPSALKTTLPNSDVRHPLLSDSQTTRPLKMPAASQVPSSITTSDIIVSSSASIRTDSIQPTEAMQRRARRQERARQEKSKQEAQASKLDVIPTFL